MADADSSVADVDWASVIAGAVAAVPDEWLVADSATWGGPQAVRSAYREFLMARIDARPTWVPQLVESVGRGRSAMNGGIGCQPG